MLESRGTGSKRAAVLEKTVFHWISEYGYGAIVFLLMLGIVGLPVPDETILTFSGYLVFKNRLHFAPTVLAAFLGSSCGITLSYMLGRAFGIPLIHRYGRYLHITEERLQRVHGWLEHAGAWSLTFGYFLPGVRHLTAYVAGTSKLELRIFTLFAYSGALLWTSAFVSAGYILGEQGSKVWREFHSYAWMLTALMIGGFLIFLVGARMIHQRMREKAPIHK